MCLDKIYNIPLPTGEVEAYKVFQIKNGQLHSLYKGFGPIEEDLWIIARPVTIEIFPIEPYTIGECPWTSAKSVPATYQSGFHAFKKELGAYELAGTIELDLGLDLNLDFQPIPTIVKKVILREVTAVGEELEQVTFVARQMKVVKE